MSRLPAPDAIHELLKLMSIGHPIDLARHPVDARFLKRVCLAERLLSPSLDRLPVVPAANLKGVRDVKAVIEGT